MTATDAHDGPVTLHVETFGTPDKPALVFLGSLGANLSMWRDQAVLADDYYVIFMDLLGHGSSPVPDGPYTISGMAEDVLHTLDELGVGVANVVGLSIGGALVQDLLLQHPDRVQAAVLACTAAKFGTREAWEERVRIVLAEGTAAVAQQVASRWFTPSFGERGYFASFEDIISHTDRVGYAGAAAALADFDSRAQLATVTRPVLVISAAEDSSTPADVVRELADLIPGAEWASIAGAAHLANIEQQEEFNRLLRAFLAQHQA
ncbi:3-oxoadipate enol-lactonase [Corynebacterium sp. 13CS0277]|uniref:3-oxoadipate enol-lactonase n=1 Tax=Corynebacterium sp. 13CS0277 TaxID=2071994 RepID=UPI000D033C6F|nr:3-oxoadipate enol-lactonase [Corynebacterium sp. 13CS0277]PRQ12390.1 3-oxoadipate enol-lactonase [Corynebacterium sp. 13CS0277]